MGSTRTSRVGADRRSRVTVVGRHPVHAGKRHGAVALDPEVNDRPVENRLVLAGDEGDKRVTVELRTR